MAAASSQIVVGDEDQFFLRIFLLTKKMGRKVCYAIFHRYFPTDPKQLFQKLLSYKKKLKPYLFPSQYELLYGNPNQETDSTEFDITLLLLLIRNTCRGFPPPKKGWNRRPSASDVSEGANLERLRIRRNSLAHSGETKQLSKPACTKKWNETVVILVSLGADINEINGFAIMKLEGNYNADLDEELSILHDRLFQHIDSSVTKYSENEKKVDQLNGQIAQLQGKVDFLHARTVSCDSYDGSVEYLVQRMKRNYLKSENMVSCVEWDGARKGCFNLQDIYIESRFDLWDRKKKVSVAASIETESPCIYNQIRRSSNTPLSMCIISDPGKGKSVLMKKLALDFAQGCEQFKGSMSGITAVFLIRCKELMSYQSLEDYIGEEILKDVRRIIDLGSIMEENSEKSLFLIDGLDEIQHHDNLRIVQEVHDLLDGRIYNGASVIVTTRPVGLSTLEKQMSFFRMCFILAPFTESDIKAYIRKYFSEKDEQFCQDLYDVVTNENDIMELATSPLALSIICNIHDHSEPVPHSMPALYHELVSQMIQQFKSYYGFAESKAKKRKLSECLLKSIGHVALESMKAGQDYFEQKDLVHYFVQQRKEKKGFFSKAKECISGINATSILQLGFITADRGSNPRKINWRYQFEPKSCQKYIAAEYIVHKILKHGVKYIHKMLDSSKESGSSEVCGSALLKENYELYLFIVDSLGRRGERDLCVEFYNEVFKDFEGPLGPMCR